MELSKRQLFIQALSDGIIEKYEEEISFQNQNIRCSRNHYKKLNQIAEFNISKKDYSSKKVILALLLSAALLLASCTAYIYKDEIEGIFEKIYKSSIELTYGNGKENESTYAKIDPAYYLSYIPEGYTLTDEVNLSATLRYEYTNTSGNTLIFIQFMRNGSLTILSRENSETAHLQISGKDIYYHYGEEWFDYIWVDDTYVFSITFNEELSDKNVENIISGIIPKT